MPEEEPQWKKLIRLKPPTAKRVRVHARRLEGVTLKHAHKYVISRWSNLRDVRRHAFGWLVLAGLLVIATGLQLFWVQQAFSSRKPVAGGTYAEGVIGRIDTLNPIFASTQSERSVSYLLFSSLFRYDTANNLASDLGDTWKKSDDGKIYTVAMRSDAKWQDGQPVTAADVVFTLGLIKNPQVNSYLYRTWQDVSVKALDAHTIQFTLPSAYAPFPHALTFGVLPKHILQGVTPSRLRENSFSREPVGSGMFVFKSTQIINPDADRVVVQLERNNDYYGGPVKLERFQVHTYKDHDDLRQAFMSREINAANEVTTSDIKTITNQLPSTAVSDTALDDGVYAFFRTDQPMLTDPTVRHALVKATDTPSLRKALGGLASPLNGPLLPEQTPSAGSFKQAAYDPAAAAKDLDAAGWKLKNGVRVKDGQRLQLSVVAPQAGDFPEVLGELAKQWRNIGVDVKTQLVPTSTFEQNILTSRAYDVLLYELALGADPDVFAYWHSSQASVHGFNLSNYRSGVADDALVSARGRSEPELRDAKYKVFFRQWLDDAPAVALYRPHLRYVTTDTTSSVELAGSAVDTLSRYNTVSQWTVQQQERSKTP